MSSSKKTNDGLDAYWAKRAKELPHHEPAHVTQARNMPQQLLQRQQQMNAHSKDLDVSNLLQQKMLSAQTGGQAVSLRDGFPFYKAIDSQGFGHTVTLAKKAGTTGGPTAKSVFLKNERKCLVVDDIQSIDFSKINEASPNIITLVEITVPYIGGFLVQKEAIVSNNVNLTSPGNSRQILKG